MFLNDSNTEFTVTMSEVDHYLDLQVEQFQNGSIYFHQEAYLNTGLEQFNMENAEAVTILAHKNRQICCFEIHGGKEKINDPYRKTVGSFLYL